MATLKICVRNKRRDGFYPVYIRIMHHGKASYIKTDKMVNSKGLSRTGEVKDPYVLNLLSEVIVEYMDRLNRRDTRTWTTNEVREFLESGDDDISFSKYCRLHHDRMIDAGQIRNARNYELAYQHLERFIGTNNIMFSQLTSVTVNKWIKSLATTHRAKEMYPTCLRQIFKSAQVEYNDYDTGMIKIKTNPWVRVKIPHSDVPEKLAITPEACRAFFAAPIPDSNYKISLPELGRDVAMLVFCLAGINTIDLFQMKKTDYLNGIIHYQRAKTKNARADGAYIEMRVPQVAQSTFDKYLSKDEKSEYLFNFHERYNTSDSFGANVNHGIRMMCDTIGISKNEKYCVYTFRHTWGTIAQNDCHATLSEVAFAMNHSIHQVTKGYIKIDFLPAWELNEKVCELVFFTEKISNRETEEQEQVVTSLERISTKHLIKAQMFYRGKKLYELQDIGFHNVDEIIAKLALNLPSDIPDRAMVQFRISNIDKGTSAVYVRMKGKGI